MAIRARRADRDQITPGPNGENVVAVSSTAGPVMQAALVAGEQRVEERQRLAARTTPASTGTSSGHRHRADYVDKRSRAPGGAGSLHRGRQRSPRASASIEREHHDPVQRDSATSPAFSADVLYRTARAAAPAPARSGESCARRTGTASMNRLVVSDQFTPGARVTGTLLVGHPASLLSLEADDRQTRIS